VRPPKQRPSRSRSGGAALPQREDLAAAIAGFVAGMDLATLDADAAGFVRRWQIDVRLGGAGLAPEVRAEVRALAERLIELQSAFMSNLLEIAHLELTADDLEGVSEAVTSTLKPGSTPGTFDVPVNEAVFYTVLERGRRRDVRERVSRAKMNRGMPANREILDEATAVRRRLGQLLGYRSWLELRIESLAASDTASIDRFIDETGARLEPFARREFQAIRELLLAEPGAPADLVVEEWDWRYADFLQRGAAGGDPQELEAYLEFEEVVRGLAALSESVLGVRLVEHPERRGWHPDVRAFDLEDRDTDVVLSRIFFDPYVREGKAGNPFMELLDPGVRHASGVERPPTLMLVSSAPAPGDVPSLISADDVDTLFHEYGHVLDFGLARGRFALQRGEGWIRSDWIEGPSLFLGRWGLHPDVIGRFARHHRTGEPIPADILEPLDRLDSLNTAIRMIRWLSQARIDVLIHGEEPVTIDEASRRNWSLRGTPYPEATCELASFPQLMVGYDARRMGSSGTRSSGTT
jgi:Zn-dependent oligopeptidase